MAARSARVFMIGSWIIQSSVRTKDSVYMCDSLMTFCREVYDDGGRPARTCKVSHRRTVPQQSRWQLWDAVQMDSGDYGELIRKLEMKPWLSSYLHPFDF